MSAGVCAAVSYIKAHQTREILRPSHPTPATLCAVARTTFGLSSGPNTQPKPLRLPFFKRVGCGFLCVRGEAYRMCWDPGNPAGGRGIPTVGGGAPCALGVWDTSAVRLVIPGKRNRKYGRGGGHGAGSRLSPRRLPALITP